MKKVDSVPPTYYLPFRGPPSGGGGGGGGDAAAPAVDRRGAPMLCASCVACLLAVGLGVG